MAQPNDPAPPVAAEMQRRGFDAFVIVLGVLVSLAAFAAARGQEDQNSEDQLDSVADEYLRAASAELRSQRLVLEAVRSHLVTDSSIDRAEFGTLTAPLLGIYPGFEAIEWVPAVAAEDRDAFEALVRPDEAPAFRIHPLSADGTAQAIEIRPTLYPVLYAQPAPLRAEELGLDRGSEPGMLAALERAAATGATQTCGPYPARDAPRDSIYYTSIPVFERPGIPATTEERLQSLRGFVVGSFSVERIFGLALAELPPFQVELEVFDETSGKEIRRHSPRDSATIAPAIERPLGLGGVRWTLRCWRYQVVTWPRHSFSWLLLGFGLLLTGLLALHLRGGQERAHKLALSNRALTRQIQERHAAEARSRETQRALTTLFSNLPGMAYRCLNDQDWTMEFLSDGCLPLTGYHPAEIQSGAISFGSQIIHEEDRERVWHMVQHGIERREAFQMVYRITTKQGETRWVWEQGRGVFDGAGELEVLEGFITDISAQKSAEQGLRKEKHFSDTAIDSLPGIFYLFNSEGRYLRWNKNLEQVTGYSTEEVAAIHPLQMVPPDERERVELRINEVFETGSSTVEASIFTKSEERIPYFFTGRRITLDGQLCLLGMGVDVTERVRAEEDRQAIQLRVLETQKLESIGILAGGIAHDFNNLLTTIVGNLRFARDRIPEASPAREFVNLAEQASDRAGDLTRQLLAYTGRANFERLPIDLSDHIRKIAHLLATSISKKVILQLKLDEGLPAVEADPTQVQQVVMNLVLNGAESCGEDSGVVRVRTETRTLEAGQMRDPHGTPLSPGRYVSLIVEDTGCGMDEAKRSKIFDPFFTTKFTGRGLGLAAVLGIVRGHDGAIEVRSSPGRGTAIEVLLPASDRPSQTTAPRVLEDLSGQGLILVADDEPSVLMVVRQTLSDCGYEVLEAVDGHQAVEIFRRRGDEIDMVLLDMTMPVMNGAEALSAIHAMRPEVPALLSSGYDEEEATRDALGAGLAGFIQKPYTPEELAAKVKEVLAGPRTAR